MVSKWLPWSTMGLWLFLVPGARSVTLGTQGAPRGSSHDPAGT